MPTGVCWKNEVFLHISYGFLNTISLMRVCERTKIWMNMIHGYIRDTNTYSQISPHIFHQFVIFISRLPYTATMAMTMVNYPSKLIHEGKNDLNIDQMAR